MILQTVPITKQSEVFNQKKEIICMLSSDAVLIFPCRRCLESSHVIHSTIAVYEIVFLGDIPSRVKYVFSCPCILYKLYWI